MSKIFIGVLNIILAILFAGLAYNENSTIYYICSLLWLISGGVWFANYFINGDYK